MYFPYLRGRQFELIALREFAIQKGDSNKVFPIIEPVKKSFNSIRLALKIFKENNLPFALIMNPRVGDLEGNRLIYDELKDDLEGCNWIPALTVTNNIHILEEYIQEYGFKKVMLVLTNFVDPESETFMPFILKNYVEYVVTKENKTLTRNLRRANKNVILLNDCFNKLDRNKDYLVAEKEKFTDEHMFYNEEGKYGFSDYVTVPNEYTEGGSTPYAVSIHLTYQRKNEEIWIRHFTSVTNDDQSNIQGKFAEAAEKAILFLDNKGIQTHATNELRDYYHNKKYPGLGMVKKISIKHHLELISKIL